MAEAMRALHRVHWAVCRRLPGRQAGQGPAQGRPGTDGGDATNPLPLLATLTLGSGGGGGVALLLPGGGEATSVAALYARHALTASQASMHGYEGIGEAMSARYLEMLPSPPTNPTKPFSLVLGW